MAESQDWSPQEVAKSVASNKSFLGSLGGVGASIAGAFGTGGMSLIPGIAGAIGGLFGQGGNKRIELAPPSASELAGEKAILQNMPELQNIINQAGGAQDMSSALNAQRGYANMLQQYAQGGFIPGQADIARANEYTGQQFALQDTLQRQAFDEQRQQASRLAAQLGRQVNDPILQAKLAKEQLQSNERLAAQKTQFSSAFAQDMMGKKLGYTGESANVLQGIADRAASFRQGMVGLGSQLEQAGRQFRAATAGQSYTQGGGVRDAITGAFGGIGAGMQWGAMQDQRGYTRAMTQAAQQPGYGVPKAPVFNFMTPGISGGMPLGNQPEAISPYLSNKNWGILPGSSEVPFMQNLFNSTFPMTTNVPSYKPTFGVPQYNYMGVTPQWQGGQ